MCCNTRAHVQQLSIPLERYNAEKSSDAHGTLLECSYHGLLIVLQEPFGRTTHHPRRSLESIHYRNGASLP